MYLLGLDIGTTNWKANLYDLKGRLVKSVSTPTPLRKDGRGNNYYDPGELWSTFCRLTKLIAGSVRAPEQIVSISFGSMAEAGLIVDASGKPLSHIIPWFDKRTLLQAEKLQKKISKETIFNITGINLQYIFSVCKILWLKENDNKAFKKAKKWLCVPDYLVYKFSGVMATDYSIASRTALFDLREKKWSKRMLKASGISEAFLPVALPSGTAVGNITAAASKECGLSVKTRVVLGGHDHLCGGLGAGIYKEGVFCDSMGTSESAVVPLKNLRNLKKYYKTGFSFGCYVFGGLYYAMSGIYLSGGLIDWLAGVFYGGSAHRKKNELYELLIKDANSSVPGSGGLMVYPHWLGIGAPHVLRHARGVMAGFTPESKKEDIINAAFEGLAFEYRLTLETLEKAVNFKFKVIKTIGGGSRNRTLLQRKADIMGRDLLVPHVFESVCFGAALLGGLGAGVIKDPQELIKNFKQDIIRHDKKLFLYYNKYYKEHYLKLYANILPYWEKQVKNVRRT